MSVASSPKTMSNPRTMNNNITWPKYIVRRTGLHFHVLQFNRLIPNMDIAEYGRINDRGTVSWRTFEEICNKFDFMYIGKYNE